MLKIIQEFNKEPDYDMQQEFGNQYGFSQKGQIVYELGEDFNIFECMAALLEALRIEGYSPSSLEDISDALEEIEASYKEKTESGKK